MRNWNWMRSAGILDLLTLPEIQQQRNQLHHWSRTKFAHTLLSTFIISLLAPRTLREIAARSMMLHDIITTYSFPCGDWRVYVPWWAIRIFASDAKRSAEFAREIGLHPAGCRAIAKHMHKYILGAWFDELTALVMLADAMTSLIETIAAPFEIINRIIHKRNQRS